MINSYFYSFDKRKNSTKRPTGGTRIQVEFKAPTDIIRPTIRLNYAGSPHGFNYLYIPDFAKYYYVDSWRWIDGLWECDCSEDYLATWKDVIGESTQYILRSSHTYNTNVGDNYYPTRGGTVNYYAAGTNPFASTFDGGCYVVGLINSDSGGVGAVHYYVMSQFNFNRFLSSLMTDINWMNISTDEISEGLQKGLINPFQYVASCMWLPVQAGTSGSKVSELPYGWWTLSGQSAAPLAQDSAVYTSVEFTLPKHPQAADRGKWLNNSPYTTYTLYFQPFGGIPIDTTMVYNQTTVTAGVNIDPITGNAVCRVTSGGATLTEVSGQVGVPIQLSQMAVDYVGAAKTAANTIGGLVGNIMSGNIGGLIANGVSGVIDTTTQARIPQMQTSGANGSKLYSSLTPHIMAQCSLVVPENNAHWGRPLCDNRKISDLPGFVMCADPDISFNGTSIEQDGVRQYLTSGIYYE